MSPEENQTGDKPVNERTLLEIVSLAKKAGEAIMRVYQQDDFGTTYKDDRSPLTEADMAAHHIIVDALEKQASAQPVLTEESTEIPYTLRQKWERYWLIDPLDGTKEFIKRSDEFTVNIALIEQGVPVLGVVYAPALDISYFAAVGLGAFKKQGEAAAHRITVADHRTHRLKIAVSRLHGGAGLASFLEKIPAHDLVRMGSSLKICLVAEGAADLYPRLGRTMEWDTAAAHAVVNEAGGSVTDVHGVALIYNKADLANPEFFVRGNPVLPLPKDWDKK